MAARKATAKSDSIETSSSLIIFYLLDHNITFWISMLLSLSLYLNIVKALIIITDYAVINKEVPSLSLLWRGWLGQGKAFRIGNKEIDCRLRKPLQI